MAEKRNRNGGSRRGERVDFDEATLAGASEGEASAPAAPGRTRKPKVPPGKTEASGAKPALNRVLLILLVALSAAALGYRYFVSGGGEQASAPAALPPPSVTVAKPLVKEMMEWSDFTGQFEAREAVEIRARVSGYLESVDFTDGQLVDKGDLLFVIEPRPFELALQTAKAEVSQRTAQLDLANAQLSRTAKLRENEYATKETYDERVAELNIATAARESAIAAENQAQLSLDYTRVTAPVSGRAGRHEVSVGNLVMGGTSGSTTLLTTIVSLDPIWLIFNVSEGDGMTYKRLVQKGEIESARDNAVEVQGQLMDEKDWTLKGTIDFVDNQYDRSSGTIRVRATFPNRGLFITPGQFGRVRVPMSQNRPTMLVPDAAVVTDQSVKMLFTVAPDGTVVANPVVLGPVTDEGFRIVRSGITAGDEVIINGLLRARPGHKVTPEQGEIQAPASMFGANSR